MLGRSLAIVGLITLASCGPSTETSAPAAESTTTTACNDVTPNVATPVQMRSNATPSAHLPPLTQSDPATGIYDLVSGEQFDGAPSWEDTRYVSLMVTNSHEGLVFDWAQFAGQDAAERGEWSAAADRAPNQALTFTCGRTGSTPVSYSASADGELQLRMPDASGTGMLVLVFVRRTPS